MKDDMVSALALKPGQIFTRQEATEWFATKYETIKPGSIRCHLLRLSTNARVRLHYNAKPGEDDVFFKIDSEHFRLYDSYHDPMPIHAAASGADKVTDPEDETAVLDLSEFANVDLKSEFERIRCHHRAALRKRIAREVLGSSVIRVFAQNTKAGLQAALHDVPVDQLPQLGEEDFRDWFETQLEVVAKAVRVRNLKNARLLPGLKWGHSSKVLCLYLRGLVDQSRYFKDEEARKIARWLYAPIDGIVMSRLRKCGVNLRFRKIREIDTAGKFYSIQNILEQAARKVGVPRVWFDDNWADRMAFVTYENRRNPHVTIHVESCSQIRKRGGEHAHGQGEYHNHASFSDARQYAQQTKLRVIECSFCKPADGRTVGTGER